jgi:hypothetical protein
MEPEQDKHTVIVDLLDALDFGEDALPGFSDRLPEPPEPLPPPVASYACRTISTLCDIAIRSIRSPDRRRIPAGA